MRIIKVISEEAAPCTEVQALAIILIEIVCGELVAWPHLTPFTSTGVGKSMGVGLGCGYLHDGPIPSHGPGAPKDQAYPFSVTHTQ